MGKMGKAVINAVCQDPELRLVGAVDIKINGDHLQLPDNSESIPLSSDLDSILANQKPDSVHAVVTDPDIHVFLHPSLTQDHSLPTLAPMEKDRIEDALIRASEFIRIVPVVTVLDAAKRIGIVKLGLNVKQEKKGPPASKPR